jgi:hypothetical protein
MSFIVFALLVVAFLAVYLGLLATWTVAHDQAIPVAGRVARILAAWLLPIGAAVAILRASAELAPECLPSRRFLWPVRWLMHVAPSRPNTLADEAGVGVYGSPGRHDGD